jgi:serine/threonine protein phosphatase PrpC
MNPSSNIHSSGQPNTNQKLITNSQVQKIIGNTILNTVYVDPNQQKQNIGASISGSKNNNIKSQIPSQNNKTSQKNATVKKNGKILNNIDMNADTQSRFLSNNSSQLESSNISQSNNPYAQNNQNNNFNNNIKAQSIHVSKDPSIINQQSNIQPPQQSMMNNNPQITPSQNISQLKSQKASIMNSNINKSNINNINASKQSMKSSLPIPPENNTLFKSNNQSIQPINSSLKKVDNIQAVKNNSAINTNQNMVMSNAPNTNPVQSALINQHQQGLPLQSQQIKPNQNLPESSLIDQNSSIKNSIHNSQQQQLNRQSQKIKQSSAIQSQMKNSNIGNNMDQSNIKNSKQNQNINPQSSNQQLEKSVNNSKVGNSSLRRNSSLRASRNKSPPLVIKTKDGQMVSTQADSNGNPYTTNIEEQKPVQPEKINSDKENEVKELNKKVGKGFKLYGKISKAGRNQNGLQKTNQDTSLIHISVGNLQGFNIFGVLDGHGPHGHFVSKFCKEFFIKTMNEYSKQCQQNNITTPEGIFNKLKESKFEFITQTFKNADLEMIKHTDFDHDFSGTTCNLVFQFNKHLLCASVGDSRGIIIYDQNNTNTYQGIFPISNDHKPNLPQEYERILQSGGIVDKLTDQFGCKVGPYRVYKNGLTYPGLAMSRSLGDFQAKDCGVITNPEIIEYNVNHSSKYMVICSDGVWEFLSNEQVRDLGNKFFNKGELGNFCSQLVKEAVHAWETRDIIRDDITVVCVYF